MNYQILNVLQDGPSGKTFLAQDKAGKKVIIRQLKTSLTKLTAENKKTEAQILRTLNHPQIPQYIDEYVDKVEGRRLLHLVREYVEGTVLTVELETQKYTYTTDWQEIYQILLQLLEIVEYIQSLQSPIIHRDIKPSNLIRRSDGKIVLIDFDDVRQR